MIHDNEDAARENAARLRVRVRDVTLRGSSNGPVLWSDRIGSVTTIVAGRMLIAKLQSTGETFFRLVQNPTNYWSTQLNLLVHE